jgi:preprotein translocase subunit Sec61beta
MPKKSKVQMPQSTAGLVRYFEESKEAIKLKPQHIVAVCIVLIALELMLKFGLLGF